MPHQTTSATSSKEATPQFSGITHISVCLNHFGITCVIGLVINISNIL
ncbi:hypothetical protein GW891_01245 [bacterium]|nr:hypothetical protein [bacterium]